MIKIVNISPDSAGLRGPNKYRILINSTVIAEFEHDRDWDGLATCLRDAADAVEKSRTNRSAQMLDMVNSLDRKGSSALPK